MSPIISSNLCRFRCLLKPSRSSIQIQVCGLRSIIDKVFENIELNYGYDKSIADPKSNGMKGTLIAACSTQFAIGTMMVWPSIATQICDDIIGNYGWTLVEASLPISLLIMTNGCAAAFFGTEQHSAGPRKALVYSSIAFGTGLAIGSIGLYMHWLPVVYMGFGTFWGVGVGMAFSPCLHTVMQWSPDQRGLMAGASIASVATGALASTLFANPIMNFFSTQPQYVGSIDSIPTKYIHGQLVAALDGNPATKVVEIVNAGGANLSPEIVNGLYLAGSGSNGAMELLVAVGVGCTSMTLAAAHVVRMPPPTPTTSPGVTSSLLDIIQEDTLTPESDAQFALLTQAVKTPHLHLLGTCAACITLPVVGLLSSHSILWQTVAEASDGSPLLVHYALGTSAIVGSLCFGGISDLIGRKRVMTVLCLTAVPVLGSMPYALSTAQTMGISPSVVAIGASTVMISIFAGLHAVLPTHMADIYGDRRSSTQYGILMLYTSVAMLYGEDMFLRIQQLSKSRLVDEALSKMSAVDIISAFHAPAEQAKLLIVQHSHLAEKLWSVTNMDHMTAIININSQLLYTMGGLAAVATISNLLSFGSNMPASTQDISTVDFKKFHDRRKKKSK